MTSMLGNSSPQAAWCMVNQIQLILLLPVLVDYMPNSLAYFIYGMENFSFSFNFIPIKSIYGIKELLNLLSYEQSNSSLKNIGLESESTLYNIFVTLWIFIILAISHYIVLWIYSIPWIKKKDALWKKIIAWVFNAMTFGVYIRLLCESYLYFALSSIAEVKSSNFNSVYRIISFSISIFILIICFLHFSISCFKWWKLYKDQKSDLEKSYFREYFNGIRDNWKARAYTTWFLIKRTVFWVVIIALNEIYQIIRISIFWVVQCASLCFIIIFRPFKSVKDNLIETINEVIYSTLCWSLLYLNKKSTWNGYYREIYMYLIISCSLIVVIVSLTFFTISLVKAWISWKKSKPSNKVTNEPANITNTTSLNNQNPTTMHRTTHTENRLESYSTNLRAIHEVQLEEHKNENENSKEEEVKKIEEECKYNAFQDPYILNKYYSVKISKDLKVLNKRY
jgi:hypothetical protein